MKKTITVFIAILLCVSMAGNVYAENILVGEGTEAFDQTEIETFLSNFFYVYFSAWEYLQVHDDLNTFIETNENTLFMIKEMEYWIEFCKVFTNCQYRNLEIDTVSIKDFSVENDICQLAVYVKYSYNLNTAEGYRTGCGEVFQMEIILENGAHQIVAFDSDATQYSYHRELLMGEENSITVNAQDDVETAFEAAVQEIAVKKATYDAWIASWSTEEAAEPMINGTTFNTSKAIEYAKTYGEVTQNEIFKRMESSLGAAYSNDCTNFVSQCIWIGTGGAKDYSITENKQELRDLVWTDYKMFPQWFGACYGKTGLPTGAWMRVGSLWDLVTTCTSDEGPVGIGYNNNKTYATCPNVYPGNVVQFAKPEERYSHSVMVVETGIDNEVYVAQHDFDYSHRLLTPIIEYFGGEDCYMRLIKFAS